MKYVGVDLGKRVDPAAIAVVEQAEALYAWMPPHDTRLGVRWLERVARRIEEVVWQLNGECEVAVDATGLGAPVVDLLREARLGCELAAVVITGGKKPEPVGQRMARAEAGPDRGATDAAGEGGTADREGDAADGGAGAGADRHAGYAVQARTEAGGGRGGGARRPGDSGGAGVLAGGAGKDRVRGSAAAGDLAGVSRKGAEGHQERKGERGRR